MRQSRSIIKSLVENLESDRRLDAEGYKILLDNAVPDSDINELYTAARRCADSIFGRNVRVRGLIEITNYCRNNCYYCGLRRDNLNLHRYALTDSEIMECCQVGYESGLRTFVLQGGENPAFTADRVTHLVADIHSTFPDAAVTLSLGEWPDEAYRRFYEAGARRYLLRHETHNPDHYSSLHPSEMSSANRLRCLSTLKSLGYQTGTGIMVGSPCQTIDNIVEDIMYMEQLSPEMIGIGPFLPHRDTPFHNYPAGSISTTLRLISIFRLMFPGANIPSTTALATISDKGRNLGIMAGANVVMPNLSPIKIRKYYSLYDNKAVSGAEAIDGLKILGDELSEIGFQITTERGDFKYV